MRLRPFDEEDLDLVDRWCLDPDFSEPFEWVGFHSIDDHRRRWEEDRFLGRSPWSLVVEADGAAVGWVDWRREERTGPDVLEIGILLAPEHRGRGLGAAAQRQLVAYLFAHTTVHRIWAGTEVDNEAEQRALEAAGLRREGLLRGHHFRAGAWRDSYVYGIVRGDEPPDHSG